MDAAAHFDRMAAAYAGARPPYPAAVYDLLAAHGVIAPGARVLEVGAGSGEATRELVARGCVVTAVEPGPHLASILRAEVPEVRVVGVRVEETDLPAASLDAVVAATSLHWVDLEKALPMLHRALRPGGRLAAWRTSYGDPDDATPFRREVARIVARRPGSGGTPGPPRPTLAELVATGHFRPVASQTWRWDVDMSPDQLRRLFASFSGWAPDELTELADAAETCGPVIRETYTSTCHVVERVDLPLGH